MAKAKSNVTQIPQPDPPDRVSREFLLLTLSEARAARFLLDVVTHPDTDYGENRVTQIPADTPQRDVHLAWIRSHALDWLRDCHDRIEADYRKLRKDGVA